jgi:hypothetical protein
MTAIHPKPELKKEPNETEAEEPKQLTSMHLSLAEHGRTGKSTWMKLLIAYSLQKNKLIQVVDTDVKNPDVARSYTPELLATWSRTIVADENISRLETSDPRKEVKQSIDSLLSEQIVFTDDNRLTHLTRKLLKLSQLGKDIMVNIPAGVHDPVCNFIAENRLDKSPALNLVSWWVSNCSLDSLNLFVETQERFPDAKHALVLNYHNKSKQEIRNIRFPIKIKELVESKQVKLVRIPHLSIDPTFWNYHSGTPYDKFIEDEDIDMFDRAAVKEWMEMIFEGIESTHYI